MGLNPRTPGSCPGPKAGTKSLSHPGIPRIPFFKKKYLYYFLSRTYSRRKRSINCIYVKNQISVDEMRVQKAIHRWIYRAYFVGNNVRHLELSYLLGLNE